jgi:hypothetical protein
VRWWEIPPLARPEGQTHMYEVKSEKITKVTIVVRQDYIVAMKPRLCPDKCLHYRGPETGTSANIIVCLDNGWMFRKDSLTVTARHLSSSSRDFL